MNNSQVISENRAALQEQVYNLQNQNILLAKQIGKILRQSN